MSRSKHTDPRFIRAARRLRAPGEERGAGDVSRRRQHGSKYKAMGAIGELESRRPRVKFRVQPRIVTQPPRIGFHHPAGRREILDVLEALGPVAIYGLRSIELARAPTGRATRTPAFGRYHVPGRIVLFEQPAPPWRLPTVVSAATVHQFERAGAVVKLLPEVGATVVDWPIGALRRFMLEEVLLHEIGHHMLQQHKGKRSVRIARTRDHEAFAARFAEKHRPGLLEWRRLQA